MTQRYVPLSGFARNLVAYGASEVATKLSRLVVVIAVSRSMEVGQIGMAAGALAGAEILKSLTETGVGQRIIAAPAADLAATCNTARRIFTVWCVGLCALQVAIAAAIWALGGDVMLAIMLAILGAEHLFMPAGLVQTALAMREGKLSATAAIGGAQVVGANLMSAALAVMWPSALALVLPRLLVAPIWLIAMRRLRPWRPDPMAGHAPLAPFVRFGRAVLGVEIAKALRLQSDKLVVGLMLGAESLGLFFMAFNAGLGLATSFSTALSTVLFPHLCAAEDRAGALRRGMILSMGLIVPAVVLQSLLAPVYVPILFGDRWAGIDEVVSILCLAAIPATLWASAAGWLRANDRPEVELKVTVALAVLLTLNTVLLAPFGLTAIAVGYLAVASVVMLGASLPAIGDAFAPQLRKA
ncbi:MAG: PST family polysaccharide transporter [Paracoccaceae bacterium]|jgi:PST family polysaccharide transporter